MVPAELRKGDKLTADWINQLVREAVARALNAGPGLRKTRSPSGTTLSLARPDPRRGLGVWEGSDYPWHVTAEPYGANSARLHMTPGALIVDTASGPSMITDIVLDETRCTASASGYVVVDYAADGSLVSAGFSTSVHSNTSSHAYLPVARITKTGGVYSVTQYLAGAFFAFMAVDEEV
jgi:hypothetical protein